NFYENSFASDEYRKSSVLLCLGFMLGVSSVDMLIHKILDGVWKNSGKEIVEFVMKTAGFVVAKKILTNIGEKLTQKGATNIIGKSVPLLGGLLSGGITYAGFKSAAAAMQKKLIEYNEDFMRGM
nr:hypothetical protein [Bacteroidales bacterium]